MGMNGEYLTLADAVGEGPRRGPVFIPGEDFNPYDQDDADAVRFAGEISKADRVRRLEEENAALRAEVARLRDGGEDVEADFAPEPYEVSDGIDVPSYGS